MYVTQAAGTESRIPGWSIGAALALASQGMDRRSRSRSREAEPRFYPQYDGQRPENVEMDLRMYREIVWICNPDYEVIQNPLLITQIMQPLSDILGVPVPTYDVMSEMFEKVDARCGGCNSSDGCSPFFVIQLFREYAAQYLAGSR